MHRCSQIHQLWRGWMSRKFIIMRRCWRWTSNNRQWWWILCAPCLSGSAVMKVHLHQGWHTMVICPMSSQPGLGNGKKDLIYLSFPPLYIIFARDRLRLNKVSEFPLSSACTTFARDRVRNENKDSQWASLRGWLCGRLSDVSKLLHAYRLNGRALQLSRPIKRLNGMKKNIWKPFFNRFGSHCLLCEQLW